MVPSDDYARMETYVAATPIHSVAEHAYRVDSGPLTVFNSRRLVPLEMTRGHLRQMCTELDLKKFSERWCVVSFYFPLSRSGYSGG